MGTVAEFFRGIVKSTKILVQKVGAFLFMIFLLGTLAGAYIIAADLSKLWFAAFGIVVVVLWNDFGEGIGILLLILFVFLFFPDVLPRINV